jgi:2,5-diamino-6-(ribosylamino)-4(3H)-pyrimidinone 5'-phosphate reductase
MKRPKVIVNCAMSADGKIALPSGKQLRISSDEDMKRVYELRHQCDAVLVGIGTILMDDPKLTVKEKYVPNPRQPLRVILDAHGRTPSTALVANDTAETIIFTTPQNTNNIQVQRGKILACPETSPGMLDLQHILSYLSEQGVKTILVEGGSSIIWSFFSEQLVDEFFVYIGSLIIGGDQTPTVAGGQGIPSEKDIIPLQLKEMQKLGSGVLLHYKR